MTLDLNQGNILFKNYILITLRTFSREKVYAIINVLGLSIALACCMILVLYVRSELSYDRHYLNHDRIARVVQEIVSNGQSLSIAIASPAVGPLIARNYSHLGEYVRFDSLGDDTVVRVGSAKHSWDSVYFVDNNVFDIFTHNAVYGDLQNALTDPTSIVISQSLARTYWGETNPVGKTLEINTDQYRVSAVFEDLPETTHLKYDALLPYDILMASFGRTNESLHPENLLVSIGYTYFKVPEGLPLNELERTLNQYYTDIAGEPGKDIDMHVTYRVQALADIHFDTAWDYDQLTGNIFYLYGFSAVALFILIIACINYTNLAIARATKRAKEVGMRKVIGAGKSQLVTQFIGESLLYSAIAFCLGLFLVEVLETFTGIASLLGKQELLDFQQDPPFILWLGISSLGLGVIAGLYPAFYLSSISPMAALTAQQRDKTSKFSIRELLVFVQFFVSIAVLTSTLLMALQMQYVANKPLGFEKENRINIHLRGADVVAQLPVIKNELLNHPNIIGVAESSFVPGDSTGSGSVSIEANDGHMEDTFLWVINVSQEFFDVMGMELVSGRGFSLERPTDVETAFIVNEALVKKMNWNNPLAKKLSLRVIDVEGSVVGVVKDFNFASLRQSVQPLAIYLRQSGNLFTEAAAQRNATSRTIIVQLSGKEMPETLRYIESVITRFDTDHPFEFTFFEDALNDLYASEENLMALTGIFAVICIFIASMGLYGLTAFNTEQRTKEIGVRKVLGASVNAIILMLAKGQLILIGVSAVLASVVSYMAINNWLTAFAYRAEIANWPFFVSTFLVALIAFTTIALQSSKTARSNPVDALRYE